MFSAAPEPKEIWVLAEASHQNFHELEPAEYEQRIRAFFTTHLHQGGDR